jgi:hypothetical protein
MNTSSSINIFDLAGYGLKAWFWNSMRDCTRDLANLRGFIERISGGKSVDTLFDEALRKSLDMGISFLLEKKALGERSITLLKKTTRLLLADQTEITQWIESKGSKSVGEAFMMLPDVQLTVEAIAKPIAEKTGAVRSLAKKEVEEPSDRDGLKKILATYNFHYSDGLQIFRDRVLAHKGWNEAERFVLEKIFEILQKEASDPNHVQPSDAWEARMRLLNEVLTRENPDIKPHLDALMSPQLRIAAGAISMAVQAAPIVADAIPVVVSGVKQLCKELQSAGPLPVLQAMAHTTMAQGAVAFARKAAGTVEQIKQSAMEPVRKSIQPEELFSLMNAARSNKEPESARDARKQTGSDGVADPHCYFPLGNRSELVAEQGRLTGTPYAVSVRNHAHVAAPGLDQRMTEASESALRHRRQEWCPLEFSGDYLLSAAFLQQEEQMVLHFPPTPGEAPDYYAAAWNIGKAGWRYGMSWVGYQESPEQQRLRQRLNALDHACRGDRTLVQEASRYLDRAFAQACLLEPLQSLRVDGKDDVLRLPTSSSDTLLRMHPDGPGYKFTVERGPGRDDTAITIEATWPILEYGRDTPSLAPQDAGNSVVRSSVQVILRATEGDVPGAAGLETAIYPLGISASIENRVVFSTGKPEQALKA